MIKVIYFSIVAIHIKGNFIFRTDAFQIIIMFIGLFASLIKGLIDVGGFKNVIDINRKYGRIDFFV